MFLGDGGGPRGGEGGGGSFYSLRNVFGGRGQKISKFVFTTNWGGGDFGVAQGRKTIHFFL